MKKKCLIYLLSAVLLCSAPVYAYAAESPIDIEGEGQPSGEENGDGVSEEETLPEEVPADEMPPEENTPDVPEETSPDIPEQEEVAPDETVPEETEPDAAPPEESLPDETAPEDIISDNGFYEEENVPNVIVEEEIPEEIQEQFMEELGDRLIQEDITAENETAGQEDGVTRFVQRMYTVALNREAEKAGLEDWIGRLRSGNADGAEIARGFITGDEFKNRKLNNSDYVDVLYRTFFDREADDGGKKNWMGKLEGGMSREYVLRGFVNSAEFQSLCDSFGIKRGEMRLNNKRDQNEGITMFVYRLYAQVLNRDGEEMGMEDWTGRILDKKSTPEEVAKKFILSEEFTNKGLDNTEYVKVLYRAFMGREYDEAGLESWVGKLEMGMSRERVLEGFSRSVEFSNILASYGLSLDPIKSEHAYADEVIKIVNQEREKAGASPLRLNKALEAAANIRARELPVRWSHTRPDGSSCFTAIKDQGLVYMMAGENIAAGYASPSKVMNGWMNSTGHRNNILNSRFTEIGVGYYQHNGYNYWVQLFMTSF